MVEALMENETLDVGEIEKVFFDVPKWQATETQEVRLLQPPAISGGDPGRDRVAAATRGDKPHPS